MKHTHKGYSTFSTRHTPQSEPIPGSTQVKNSAGGYSFTLNDWDRLDRFLVTGSDTPTYYASAKQLTKDNAESVIRCIHNDGPFTVAAIVEASTSGAAVKNDAALFALSLCLAFGDDTTKGMVEPALQLVARIPTHLFMFINFALQFRGWGRRMRRIVSNWYNSKSPSHLAYQVVKYQSRDVSFSFYITPIYIKSSRSSNPDPPVT
jgi:60 kDa SS-A/Ro ribonucleoprotein